MGDLVFFFIRIVLVIVVFLLGVLFRKKINFYVEKYLPLNVVLPLYIMPVFHFLYDFFLISLVFLVFDVELVILFPFIINISLRRVFIINFVARFFIFILIIGLYHE